MGVPRAKHGVCGIEPPFTAHENGGRTMRKRNTDPAFDPEEIEESDPLGEQGYAAEGFQDRPDGGPDFSAPGLDDGGDDRKPGGWGQKVAGVPEERQREPNTPSEQRPDSGSMIVKERGGDGKGDAAVGGTREH
jgi:hypothetical protein